MNELFYTILNMSISASILVLVVLILRLVFRKAPKWVNVLLWALVAIRLLCPFAIESPFSLMPKTDWIAKETVSTDGMSFDSVPDNILEYVIGGGKLGDNVSVHYYPTNPKIEIHRGISIAVVLNCIWILGIAAMLLYMLVSCICVYRRIKGSTQFRDNIYTSNAVSTPFVFGIVKPRIYLPESMDAVSMSYVIAHEEAHLHRRDHLWKPIGFILLAVHWFNPIIWLAYILLCRDIEMACDERVVRDMGESERVDYSEALLACSVSRRMITACPLAFGENNVKERIRTVLNYKKPAFWIVILAVIACIVAAVCFLTNPQQNTEPADENKMQNDNPSTAETGYPSGEIQLAQIVYNGRIYFYSATGFDNPLPDNFEYVGNIAGIDNISGPSKNFHGARVEIGQEIYADEENSDAIYLKYRSGYAKFEVVKSTNNTLKPGFENARIKIKHINSNGQLVNVTLGIILPEEWNIKYDYQSYEMIPFAEYADLKNGSDCVGGIGFLTYDLPEDQADIPEAIFNQIAMGSMTFWNIRQHFDVVTDESSPYRTALTSVLYSSKAFQDGKERNNSAVVSYHPEYKMYIALQLTDGTKDRTILSEEELRYVAESIEWISVELSDTGADAAGQSELFKKTVDFLSQEYHTVYDPYYEILNLAIFDWNESGNEATFRYTVTQQYWNRDPDTVDYIKATKDDPERYEMMCNDYLASKEINYFFKVVLNGDKIELYSNESPTGVEWKPRKIADYLPKSSLPITVTEVNRDTVMEHGTHEYIHEQSEYTRYLLISTGSKFTNVRITSMTPGESGMESAEEHYRFSELTSQKPLLIGVVFYGDMTTYGLLLTDANGMEHQYIICESGEDGSVVLQEY